MSIFSMISCILQFIGIYTLLSNQTFIPKEYTVKPVDDVMEQMQEVYKAHLSSKVRVIHDGFKVVRKVVLDEVNEIVDVEMIRSRLTAHMTEGYEILQQARKTTSKYTKRGIDVATAYHKDTLAPAIEESIRATYKGIHMAHTYHKETVAPAIDGTIKAIKPHIDLATEHINRGIDIAKEYTEETVVPAIDGTYQAMKPHFHKYTQELYHGIDVAREYTEESFVSAYDSIKPMMDHIVVVTTEHALSLYATGKNYTSEALKPHIEKAIVTIKPQLEPHLTALNAYLRDLSSIVKDLVDDVATKHETAFDDTTMIKVEEGVLQAVTEKVHEMNTDTPGKIQQNCNVRVGNEYKVCPETIEAFKSGGLAILENLLTEKEMLDLEILYDKHMAEGSAEKYQKDFCDMSKPFDTPRQEYSVINAMLPRKYSPEFQGNIYEQVAASIAKQLFTDVEMMLDYDQLLDKMPGKTDAVFAWHQDMAYWPNTNMTPDTRTVTFSLAFDSTNKENGCIHYIPGSGSNKTLRTHKPIGKDRDEAHAISVIVGDDEVIHHAEVKRGSASIHDEWVVHGSSGNNSNGSRRTYVIAFRTKDTVQRERAAGFTHSHNDEVNWDKFNNWGKT